MQFLLPLITFRLGAGITFLPIHILDVGPLQYENVNKLCTPYSKFHKKIPPGILDCVFDRNIGCFGYVKVCLSVH